jgi:hypothetical protein
MTAEEKEALIKASTILKDTGIAQGHAIALQINKILDAIEQTGKPNRFAKVEGTNPLQHLVKDEQKTANRKPLGLKEAAAKREGTANVLATSEKKTTRKK